VFTSSEYYLRIFYVWLFHVSMGKYISSWIRGGWCWPSEVLVFAVLSGKKKKNQTRKPFPRTETLSSGCCGKTCCVRVRYPRAQTRVCVCPHRGFWGEARRLVQLAGENRRFPRQHAKKRELWAINNPRLGLASAKQFSGLNFIPLRLGRGYPLREIAASVSWEVCAGLSQSVGAGKEFSVSRLAWPRSLLRWVFLVQIFMNYKVATWTNKTQSRGSSLSVFGSLKATSEPPASGLQRGEQSPGSACSRQSRPAVSLQKSGAGGQGLWKRPLNRSAMRGGGGGWSWFSRTGLGRAPGTRSGAVLLAGGLAAGWPAAGWRCGVPPAGLSRSSGTRSSLPRVARWRCVRCVRNIVPLSRAVWPKFEVFSKLGALSFFFFSSSFPFSGWHRSWRVAGGNPAPGGCSSPHGGAERAAGRLCLGRSGDGGSSRRAGSTGGEGWVACAGATLLRCIFQDLVGRK